MCLLSDFSKNYRVTRKFYSKNILWNEALLTSVLCHLFSDYFFKDLSMKFA